MENENIELVSVEIKHEDVLEDVEIIQLNKNKRVLSNVVHHLGDTEKSFEYNHIKG